MKCTYVEDLYPLYLEGLVSDETKKDIEQHLDECLNCREKLLTTIPEIKITEDETDTESTEIQKKAVKRYKKKFFGIIAIAVVLALIVGGAGVFGYNYYENHPHKVFNVRVPVNFRDVNFNVLNSEIIDKLGVTPNKVRTVNNGVMVAVNPDGTVKNIDTHFELHNGSISKFYDSLFTAKEGYESLDIFQYPPQAEFFGEPRKLGDVLSAFGKLSLEHIQNNIATKNYNWLNIVFTDNSNNYVDVSPTSDGPYVYLFTPTAQVKWYMIKKDGSIEQRRQHRTVHTAEGIGYI
jgi:hypothetical protein